MILRLSEKFNSTAVRWIVATLSRPIPYSILTPLETRTARERGAWKGAKIFSRDQSRRTLEEVVEDTIIGELTEVAVDKCGRLAGMQATRNHEEKTGEYHWDENLEQIELEIKTLGERPGVPRRFISFGEEYMVSTAMREYERYDFLLACRRTSELIYPWYLADSRVWDPHRYPVLWARSEEFSGIYIKTGAAVSSGMLLKLTEPPG